MRGREEEEVVAGERNMSPRVSTENAQTASGEDMICHFSTDRNIDRVDKDEEKLDLLSVM